MVLEQPILRAGIVVAMPLLDFQIREHLRACGGVEIALVATHTDELLEFLRWEPLDVIVCEEMLLQEVRPLVPHSILLIQLRRNGRPIDKTVPIPTLDLRQPTWGAALMELVKQRRQPPMRMERRRSHNGAPYFALVAAASKRVDPAAVDPESGLPSIPAFQMALAALPAEGKPTVLVFVNLQRVAAEGGYVPEILARMRSVLREHDLMFRIDQMHAALLLPWDVPDVAPGLLARMSQTLWPPHPTALVAGYASWRAGTPVDACAQQAWTAMCGAGEVAAMPPRRAGLQAQMA